VAKEARNEIKQYKVQGSVFVLCLVELQIGKENRVGRVLRQLAHTYDDKSWNMLVIEDNDNDLISRRNK